MLAARSYNGEVILNQETRMDLAVQWQWRMLRMGYAHTVIIVRGEHACGPLRQLFGEHAGCVWFERSVDYLPGPLPAGTSVLKPGQVGLFLEEPGFWQLQLAAMVLRIGAHNLLLLDTDTLVLDDVYWWMGQADYQGYHLLAQEDSTGAPNAGVMYVRGGRPGGPRCLGAGGGVHTCFDHSALADAFFSALAGRPLFARCLGHRQLDRSWSSRQDGLEAFQAANTKIVEPALQNKTFSTERPGPRCHLAVPGSSGLVGREGQLRMPHFGGQWPAELGGRALGDVGPVAAAFAAMLKEAGTPMWPDLESPDTAAAADAVPVERFAFLSRHAACDWASCGSAGMFAAGLRPPGEEPCVVVGHVTASPDRAMGKRFQLLHNGVFSPQLAAALHGPGGAFLATATGHHPHAGSARHAVGPHARAGQQAPLPRLLALSPAALSPGPQPPAGSAAPLVLPSKAAYVALIEALAGVAVAAGRALALPRLSCDYPWMHRSDGATAFNGSHYVPWTYLHGEAFAPWGPSLDQLSCEWYGWLQHGCLHGPMHVDRRQGPRAMPTRPVARMLLSAEMGHFLAQLPEEDREPMSLPPGPSVDPAAAATASLVPLPASAGPTPGPDGVFNVTLAALSEVLSRLSPTRPVLWLERPMRWL
ncbi:hypothetical protein GPECTOR_17g917 [Gonium pectorale]|uniref:Nucleotide-diphospho-sugar transferase domain-containing protein n=1 Tax=Gonium pectorale TaxID=33097 RepID=A0A150GKE4_GONPE|nr:hypothetical protein GPECTOR_17g917 [Gonium pectorale]|eukprot:KXZ50278.1 hypothetical protein GPECTOR_17g917 [Gonium pectorale]